MITWPKHEEHQICNVLSLFTESMWPGLDELKTLSKRMQMEADLEKQSRHLKTPPSGNDMSNGFYSDGNIMKRASRKITAVNTIKHGPTMLMPEVAH